MKRSIKTITTALIIILISSITIISYTAISGSTTKKVYVGVTYGGDTVEGAKLLIDKVKGYTNVFIIASGQLQYAYDNTLEEIGDYAINAGLDIIVYSGAYNTLASTTRSFITSAQERWGNRFLGVYYGDEPGGKMLDGNGDAYTDLGDVPSLGNVTLNNDRMTIVQKNGSIETGKTFSSSGTISLSYSNSTAYSCKNIFYSLDGSVTVRYETWTDDIFSSYFEETRYFTNGTVAFWKNSSDTFTIVTDRGNISQFESYQELLDSRPFQTVNDSSTVATAYVNTKQALANSIRNQSDLTLFTSDYALYWWDYKGGYDTVFAQLGWNNSVAQEIGLVRGAANLQGKSWGTILTWKYTHAPYLTAGTEMFKQMKTSYEAGAEYIIVFNYAKEMSGPYGTMQEEHFEALERFWNEVVQNSEVTHNSITVEAALVLPKDYGWGMRTIEDKIWGLWSPDETSEQIWNQLQSKLDQYGLKLDIVYDDPAYPVEGKYDNVFYWNQTS